jgi:hypothetical protein
MNDNETVEDVLLTAADTIMEFDMGEEEDEQEAQEAEADEAEAAAVEADNPFAADARRDRLKRRKKKRLNINSGEDTLDPNVAPSKLTATLLERFVRIFVMLSQASGLSLPIPFPSPSHAEPRLNAPPVCHGSKPQICLSRIQAPDRLSLNPSPPSGRQHR